MEKEKSVSDWMLTRRLKILKYMRRLKLRLEEMDEDLTDWTKTQFKIRKIETYEKPTVKGVLSPYEPREINLDKVEKKYTLPELREMGVLKIGIEDFKQATGLSDEEIAPYISTTPGKRLYIEIPETQTESEKAGRGILRIVNKYLKS